MRPFLTTDNQNIPSGTASTPKLVKRSTPDLVLSPDYSMMFSVRVDKHGEFILVCKDLIGRTSAFFRSISSDSNWRPGLTIPVDLPDVDTESFRVYTHWVNTGKLVIEPYRCERFHDFHEQKSLIEAFILGDLLDDSEYRQHVLAIIIAGLPSWTNFLSGDLIPRIWTATQSGSPLRTFALR